MKFLKVLPLFFFLIIFFGQTSEKNTDKHLFKIRANDRFGFIDSTGEVIIKPIFHSAGEFSEGVASARLNGTYGYIDETGGFIIQPQFDYAEPFRDSIAKVYIDSNLYFINHKGEYISENSTKDKRTYKNGRAIIETETKKYGLIDTNGKMILDTVFSYISDFNEGLLRVIGINHNPNGYYYLPKICEAGLVDTNGNFVVPFGKHKEIYEYNKGFYRFEDEIDSKYKSKTNSDEIIRGGLLNSKGEVVYVKTYENAIEINDLENCNLAKIKMIKHDKSGKRSRGQEMYEGLINTKGEFVLNNPDIENIYDFMDNRAFIRDKNENYYVINNKGEILNKRPFKSFELSGFHNNRAFAGYGYYLGIIDTNLNFKVEPSFYAVQGMGDAEYVFYIKDSSNTRKGFKNFFDKNKYSGIAKTDGSIILEPVIKNLQEGWFINGLILYQANNKYYYVNPNSGLVWSEKDYSSDSLLKLNIDIKLESLFECTDTTYTVDSLGYRNIDDEFKNKELKESIREDDVQVIVNENENSVFQKNYQGLKVYLINTKTKNIPFPSQDRQLEMTVQAIDKDGEWKDIEYILHSWCGNAYRILNLKPNCYWTFTTPVYDGDFKTKLRIKLEYFDSEDLTAKSEWKRKIITVYSNEYYGSVNPGQFWRISHITTPLGDLNPIYSWEELKPL